VSGRAGDWEDVSGFGKADGGLGERCGVGCERVGGEMVGEVLRRALGLWSYREVVVPEGRSRLPFEEGGAGQATQTR
jgi:hypothetical protein